MLHLIPCPIAENAMHTLPHYLQPIIQEIKIWCVEEIRSARRFLKAIDQSINIDELTFYILNEHTQDCLKEILPLLQSGKTIGVLSEAGCPAIADPGKDVVALAQRAHIKVIPHIGPSSILLSLMASGCNGEQFTFHGYIPIKEPHRTQFIKEMERNAIRGYTQIFIEAPYRNIQIFELLLKQLQAETILCMATQITSPEEMILSMKVKEWRKAALPLIHKSPTVFLIGN
jgi:16S rRNA (cytidine1402-2'-O)-methyltransferase